MNEKINLQDLSALFAEKSGIDPKEAEFFLKELIETIQEALLNEESVRIKNLGTFKRLAVSDRESVDVGTGNRIVIPAHYKISFTPDNGLANAVNEPFALFDTVELDETAELRHTETIEKPSVPEEKKEKEEDERPQVKIEEPPLFKKTPPAPGQPERLHQARRGQIRQSRKRRRKRRFFFSLLYFLVIGGLISFLGYMYLADRGTSTVEFALANPPLPSLIADVAEEDVAAVDNAPVNNAIVNNTPVNNTVVKDIVVKDTVAKTPPKIVETKTTDKPEVKQETVQKPASAKQHTMGQGDMLTSIALKEYGNKIFWVYLYEENANSIQNPNRVPQGIVITIPPASKYGINKDDPASVQKASALQQKYNKIN